MPRRTMIHVDELDASAVVAERIDCVECGDEYLGDPERGSTCPLCKEDGR